MADEMLGVDPDSIETPGVLAKKLPFRRIYYKTLKKGSLISCQYNFWRHDPYPLVLVTDVGVGPQVGLLPGVAGIRGINLHYLTYRYISNILNQYCDESNFSYRYIKNDQYMINSFRTYKRAGLRWVKLLDCEVIKYSLNLSRSFRPDQIKRIREEVQKQLNKQVNPKAEDIATQYQQQIVPRKSMGFEQLSPGMRPHGSQKPNFGTIPTQGTISASIPGIPTGQ